MVLQQLRSHTGYKPRKAEEKAGTPENTNQEVFFPAKQKWELTTRTTPEARPRHPTPDRVTVLRQ